MKTRRGGEIRPFSDATRIDVEESHIKENEMKVRVDYYAVLKVTWPLCSTRQTSMQLKPLGGHICSSA